jgi:CRISPR-associated protein Cas1
MELFRVPIVDMAVVAALNRRTFEVDEDFQVQGAAISLSDTGRRKLITALERRLTESWHHAAVGYSLSYSRLIELEVRLLEKEWSGEGGLFGKLRLR